MAIKQIIKIVGLSLIALIVLILAMGSVGTVNAGERGILIRFGAVTEKVVNEGLYFKIPIIEQMVIMDVKVQKTEVNADAASKDLQVVNSRVALNFRIDPDQTANLYQSVGVDF